LLLAASTAYSTPLETVRKGTVDQEINGLPKSTIVSEISLFISMNTVKATYSLSETETAHSAHKWIAQNIAYDYYALNHGGIDYTESGTYSKGKGFCA
jgi:hypothetical protein